MGAHGRPAVGPRSGHRGRCVREGDPLGNVAGGLHRQPDGHQPGAGAQQGGAGLQLLRPADLGRDPHRQGLRDRRFRGLLRLRHRVLRTGQQHPAVRGLQGEDGARAGAVVLDVHHRDGHRHPCARHGQDHEVGRPARDARVHRSPAVGYPRTGRAGLRRARDRARLHRGGYQGSGIAAGAGPLRPPWGSTPTPRRPPPGGSRRHRCRPTGRR